MKTVFVLAVFCCPLISQIVQPTISGISAVTTTNEATITFTPSSAGAFSVTAASCTSGTTTYTIGSNTIKPGSFFTVTGASPSAYNTASSVAQTSPGTTISTQLGCGGSWVSGGTVTIIPFGWVRYGVATGTYLWSSPTINQAAVTEKYGGGLSTELHVSINGLKDGTTYYFLPTARPDPDDESNICASSGCGANEISATTAASTVSHAPTPPTSVQANMLSEPDTTGYAIVPLAATGAGGECVSTGNVSAPAGYSGTIATNDTLSTILTTSGKLWYGTVFEIPQGTTCIVKATDAGGTGYEIPVLAVDPLASGITDPAHRWIIFRTTPGGPADFPPFGTRTGPSFFNHYGGFQSNTFFTTNPNGGATLNGTIFDSPTGVIHHFWWENLKFSVDDTNQSAIYGSFVQLGSNENGNNGPNGQYLAFRGNYFHGPHQNSFGTGAPTVYGLLPNSVDGNLAFVGNYVDNMYPRGTAAGQSQFGLAFRAATGGPYLISDNFLEGLMQTIYFETVQPLAAVPHDITILRNYLLYPYSGSDSNFPDTLALAVSLGADATRDPLEIKGGQRIKVTGNTVNGCWAMANEGPCMLFLGFGTITDVLVQSNFLTNGASAFDVSGGGNNTIPTSHTGMGNRIAINNNLAYVLGRGLFNAGGSGLGSDFIAMGTASSNLTLTHNSIIGPLTTGGFYAPWVFDYSGGGTGQMAGLTYASNLLPWGMPNSGSSPVNAFAGLETQGTISGQGVLSHPATPTPIYSPNMTPSLDYGKALSLMAGYSDGATGLGMQGASVISQGTGYPNSGALIFSGCSVPPVGTFTAAGGLVYQAVFTSFGSGCNPATYTVTADTGGGGSGASLRPHYGLTPAYAWGHNAIACMDFLATDMSAGNCASWTTTMPSGDAYPSGSTIAARTVQYGLPSTLAGLVTAGFGVSPAVNNAGDVGANLNAVISATGTTTNVSTRIAATMMSVSYTAPDAGACSVDVSTDQVTWTRHTDGGGVPLTRTLAFTGLSASTLQYYRTICYSEQLAPLYSGDQITDGSVTTLASGTVTLAVACPIAAFSGATTCIPVLTPISGGTSTCTSTGASCSVSGLAVGDYSVVRTWNTGQVSDSQLLRVR